MIDSELLVTLRAAAERAANGVLKDRRRAEDVAQDVMVRLLERDLEDVDHLDRYVVRMAKNAAIDMLRAREKEWLAVEDDVEWIGDLVETHAGPSTLAARPEFFRRVLEPLTPDQRDVFLASLDGVSNAELAVKFGYANARSVAVILTRIRQAIRKPFEDDELKDLLAISAPPAGLFAAAARMEVGSVAPKPIATEALARASALADEIRDAWATAPRHS
ncbi:RNA polymerase sigma factor [Demequina rhizosphaerae]|uniref:RNA polymerase sigma factor n=1 Tax=Demequina rhizosphaerae TaxID=1638985 RepID=UPI00155D9F89|nr:RNA polymerase sigma factor [Demequina rhizosphaerae]